MKRTPLATRSKKRIAHDTVYAEFRTEILERDDWRCQFWAYAPAEDGDRFPLACSEGLEVHHIGSRKAFPSLVMEPTNLATLCPRHHQWVTEHPVEAEAIGLYRRAES